MTNTDLDVVVVGAGVSGLTTAICLAEAGLAVAIVAERLPQDTTSAVAGAIWGPHLVEPGARTARWGRASLAVFRELAADPAAGVRIGHGIEVFRGAGEAAGPAPDWLTELGGYRPCQPAELPPGFGGGWWYTAPLVHMPTYLGYLQVRFEAAGGMIKTGTVASLADAARGYGAGAVVNCTGVGARQLVPDAAMTPVRGQIVVAANPGLDEFFVAPSDDSHELVYLFPHGDTVVLGGTEAASDWNLEPVPAVAGRILRDCAAIEPRLRDAQVLTHRVGLRPVRPTVRLEAEPASGPPDGGPLILHNYGHGGGGVTLSWGCAREITDLLGEDRPHPVSRHWRR
jgi:D-amino-acid oxidase